MEEQLVEVEMQMGAMNGFGMLFAEHPILLVMGLLVAIVWSYRNAEKDVIQR